MTPISTLNIPLILDIRASLPYAQGRIMNLFIVLVILVLGVTGAGCFLGYRLRKSLKTIKRLEEFKAKCEELTRMNALLTSGASVKLTLYERNMIRMALDYGPFRDMMRLPQTRKFIRDTWRGLRIKIRESISV